MYFIPFNPPYALTGAGGIAAILEVVEIPFVIKSCRVTSYGCTHFSLHKDKRLR